jgi:hypothetical protein
MSKASNYVGVCYECKGNLITVYMASGVKLTGRQYRVLYGTREVADVPLTAKGRSRTRIERISGGGLSRSSDEVAER